MAHADVAEEYGQLKLRLWKEFEQDRDGYTQAKSEFISKCTAKARQEFADKYRPR